MPDDPKSSIILYQTQDGRMRIQCRFDHDTLWLTAPLTAQPKPKRQVVLRDQPAH